MIGLYIFLAILFLIWMFFVSTTQNAIVRLGEAYVEERLPSWKGNFFYYPLYTVFSQKFDLLLFSTRIAANLSRFAYATVILLWATPILELWYIPVVALILGLFIGDLFPRLCSGASPEKALRFTLFFSSFFLYLAYPITLIYQWFLSLFLKSHESEKEENPIEETQKTILHILYNSNIREKLDPIDKKLIESVVKFKERIVREVMVPRIDLFSLPATTSVKEAARKLSEEGYSRVPVYGESIDDVVGVLMFRDLFQLYMDVTDGKQDPSVLNNPIEPLTKGVFYAPETKRVSHLLQEFRTKLMHMAIVVDEYGGTEGVVTMEDILEEIVGQIADEYDFDEETLYIPLPGGNGWVVDARMSLIDAEDSFDIQIPQEGEYDTIGGYVFHKAGMIPSKGFKIHHEHFDMEVLSSSERSVEKVRITVRPKNVDH
ncbi:MAG: hypothetical protein S4CHLAM81_10650 [Chlamydiales bacterium]|nr:hypothetical protein [Chlamydiales bacterium]MCH9704136.1 hemolysin family protein [Chlamydiota bacterium]